MEEDKQKKRKKKKDKRESVKEEMWSALIVACVCRRYSCLL